MTIGPRRRGGFVAPLPLLILFGAFLAAIVYLVAASLTRRSAPVFSVSPRTRTRSANWQRVGDTLTIDATDGDRWQYVSLTQGRVLALPDTSGWELGVQRYRVIAPPNGAIADVGLKSFDLLRPADAANGAAFVSTTFGEHPENVAIEHWYRYNLLTHLLEPNGHLFVIRTPEQTRWKVVVLSYYCPGLVAGCLTLRYAPLAGSNMF
jgi:hypothetical protein